MIIEFYNAKQWIDKFKKYTSYKRPVVKVPKEFKTSVKIFEQFPVPWQSVPVFGKNGAVFNIIHDNEKIVFENNICGYCGIKINDNEQCVRWTNLDVEPSHEGPRVFSDYCPLHINCMKQARIFCPHMRMRLEEEFEYGEFIVLKNNVSNDLKKFNK